MFSQSKYDRAGVYRRFFRIAMERSPAFDRLRDRRQSHRCTAYAPPLSERKTMRDERRSKRRKTVPFVARRLRRSVGIFVLAMFTICDRCHTAHIWFWMQSVRAEHRHQAGTGHNDVCDECQRKKSNEKHRQRVYHERHNSRFRIERTTFLPSHCDAGIPANNTDGARHHATARGSAARDPPSFLAVSRSWSSKSIRCARGA